MSDHLVSDDIVTYNPNHTNEHYDSSEFGDHGDDEPSEKILIRPKVFKKSVAEKAVATKKVNRVSKCPNVGQSTTPSGTVLNPCHHCGRLVKYCPKTQNLNQAEDGCSQRTSKANLTKKLSIIFQRSSNRKTATAEENNRNAINNKRVYCPECQRRQIRKFYRKQRYKAADTNRVPSEPLPSQTLLVEPTKPPADQFNFSKTNTVYASEVQTSKRNVYEYTGDCDLDKKKQYTRLMSRSQQYSGYAVYNSQCCQRNKDVVNTSGCCNMPPVPSFWEFMFNKLSAKYQEAFALATCEDCRPINCCTICPNPKATPPQETSETQTDRLSSRQKLGVAPCQKNSECQTQTDEAKSGRLMANIMDLLSPRPSKTTSPKSSKKLNTPSCSKTSTPKNFKRCTSCNKDKSVTKLPSPDNNKSCQLSHDGLTQALKAKYNGEILCIHNPPCILINGCVNLPHHTPKPLDVWQIATAHQKADPKHNYCLEICQLPSVELQCKDEKSEKDDPIMCSHRSPCEVVPICYNSDCSPEYVGSCAHDPMCNRVPVCLIETEQKITRFSCEHVPLCTGVSGSFEELDGRVKIDRKSTVSDGGTQMERPLHLICPHKPPCLRIPRCLVQIMMTRRKGGAIPDCVHNPPCENIPACGRNYVKMLAACSCSVNPRPKCRIT